MVIEGTCKTRKGLREKIFLRIESAVRPAHRAPPDLLWQCIGKSSSFIRAGGVEKGIRFSAEPGNLMGLHCMRFSGLANDKVGTVKGWARTEALDVRPMKIGKKESIELVQKPAKALAHSSGI